MAAISEAAAVAEVGPSVVETIVPTPAALAVPADRMAITVLF
jgi:hypothetical protein